MGRLIVHLFVSFFFARLRPTGPLPSPATSSSSLVLSLETMYTFDLRTKAVPKLDARMARPSAFHQFIPHAPPFSRIRLKGVPPAHDSLILRTRHLNIDEWLCSLDGYGAYNETKPHDRK